jgi:hypothetical protein
VRLYGFRFKDLDLPFESLLLRRQRLPIHMQSFHVRFRQVGAFRHRDFARGAVRPARTQRDMGGQAMSPHVSPLKGRSSWMSPGLSARTGLPGETIEG